MPTTGGVEMTDLPNADLETPVEDAAEQATSALQDRIDDDREPPASLDDEIPEWDAQEQARVVEMDDEYR
jgi:hypothetical protein